VTEWLPSPSHHPFFPSFRMAFGHAKNKEDGGRQVPGSLPVMARPAQRQLAMGPVRGLVLRKRSANCWNRPESQLITGSCGHGLTVCDTTVIAADSETWQPGTSPLAPKNQKLHYEFIMAFRWPGQAVGIISIDSHGLYGA
jgi:hypothetical protein